MISPRPSLSLKDTEEQLLKEDLDNDEWLNCPRGLTQWMMNLQRLMPDDKSKSNCRSKDNEPRRLSTEDERVQVP